MMRKRRKGLHFVLLSKGKIYVFYEISVGSVYQYASGRLWTLLVKNVNAKIFV